MMIFQILYNEGVRITSRSQSDQGCEYSDHVAIKLLYKVQQCNAVLCVANSIIGLKQGYLNS